MKQVLSLEEPPSCLVCDVSCMDEDGRVCKMLQMMQYYGALFVLRPL